MEKLQEIRHADKTTICSWHLIITAAAPFTVHPLCARQCCIFSGTYLFSEPLYLVGTSLHFTSKNTEAQRSNLLKVMQLFNGKTHIQIQAV